MSLSTKEDLVHELIEESRLYIRSGVQGLKQKLWNKSRRFVLSSKLWLHATPTQNCDVLVTLSPKDPRAEYVITWLVQKIKEKEPRLNMELRYHSFLDSYGLYLTARYDNLLRGAEILHFKKRLKQQWGGGYREFVYDERECFEEVEHKGHFFTSQERANVVWYFLQSVRAGSEEMLGGIAFREGQSIVPTLANAGLVSQILPLHNSEQLKKLQDRWLAVPPWIPQPLDQICEYFGEKIGLYFAWLSHYTKMLCAPALFGLIGWMCVMSGDQLARDIFFVALAFFNIIWASVYPEWWKRLQAEYAYKWGTLGMETNYLAEPRPYFRGDLCVSPVTGRLEPHYPPWKRRAIRYFFSYPVTFLCLVVFFFVMLLIFEVQEITNKYFGESTVVVNWILFAPKLLMAIIIFLSAEFYTRFATWLNDLENYRTDDAYENHLITKIVVFQVVSSYLPLFYIAFCLRDIQRLQVQLAALLITRQVIGNVQEAVVPFFMEKFKLCRLTYDKTRKMSYQTLEKQVEMAVGESSSIKNEILEHGSIHRENSETSEITVRKRTTDDSECSALPEFKITEAQISQAEVESLLPRYTSPLEDYLEMFIQFGYVVLFSPVFPLAPLCCLINNILEIRVDAFKLCTTMQRPFGNRVEDIGAWQTCIEFMSIVGVIVNCFLIAQSGLVKRISPDLTWADQILIVVVFEHIFLLLKFVICHAIPDMPNWVCLEIAKVEYKRREAFRRESRLLAKKRGSTARSDEVEASSTKPTGSHAQAFGSQRAHSQNARKIAK